MPQSCSVLQLRDSLPAGSMHRAMRIFHALVSTGVLLFAFPGTVAERNHQASVKVYTPTVRCEVIVQV